ncbi:hypothetical protein PspCFBP13528_14230 [Pseudomonas sp. CFBP13528]|nr:hypothetical protein PspCFBP13528_14230 [Pseudomonas sp. CFBP13528]
MEFRHLGNGLYFPPIAPNGRVYAVPLGKRMANTPTELQYLGRWCPRILSGRDHPYRQDFHAPTQLLPQTI